MTLKIEKGVPVPRRIVPGKNVAVLKRMKAGDSVFFRKTGKWKAASFRQAAYHLDIKVMFRAVPGGIRMWVKKS